MGCVDSASSSFADRDAPTYDTVVPRRRFRPARGSLPELVRTLPRRQLLSLWAAIFCTFAMIGFALDILTGGRQPAVLVATNVIASGVISVGYAIVSMPMRKWGYAAMVTVHLAYVLLVPRMFQLLPTAPPGRFTLDAIGTIVAVTISYTCFLRFISVTATRYLRAQAEIAIARDIHRVLVPVVNRTIGDFEFFGWSHASGDVGGDLVDLVEQGDGRWLGYVADVSATVDVDYEFGTFRLVNQIVIQAPPGERFATEGDSGSVVLRDAGKERVPIALVWGGRRNLTYASPLKTCLQKLDLTWVAPMGRTGSATGY